MEKENVLGRRIAAARGQLGLTQAEVAERLGVARATLAEMETGQRKVTAHELYQVADILRRSLDYFFCPEEPRVLFALRTDAEELPESSREALVELDNRMADIRRLERFSDISVRARLRSYRLDEWRNVDQAAKHIADDERSRLRLGPGALSNLREVLEEKAGILTFGHYVRSGGFSGAFASDGDHAAFLVNTAHFAGRVNFTLAHEYGHAVTAARGSHVELRGGKSSVEERFADRFAAAFLMPLQALEEALQFFAIDPARISQDHVLMLASHFGVSFAAVLGRLEHFSLVDREVGRAMRRTARPVTRGRELNLGEPRPEFPPLPATYESMALVAFHREAISRSRLAEFLGTDAEEAYARYAEWAQATMKDSSRGGRARVAAG